MADDKLKKLEGGRRIKSGGRAGERPSVSAGADGRPLPLVSVITIAFNGAAHIERTIKSVLEQSYKNVEYIIVDGGSTDGTLDIIKKYEDRIDYWVSEKDRGISDAMNKGISLATGDIVGIIHADDWYEKDSIKAVVGAFLKYSPDVVCGSLRLWDGDRPYYIGESSIDGMYYGMSIWHPTVFVRSGLYKTVGAFDLKYKFAMDYDLLMRFMKKRYAFLNMPGLVIANMSRGGTSEKNRYGGLVEEYDIRTKFGVPRASAILECARKYFLSDGLQAIKKILVKAGLGFLVERLRKIRNAGDGGFVQ